MIKTLMRRAGELEAELKAEMSQLYLKLKEGKLTDEQRQKLADRLGQLERLIGKQKKEACCGTRLFGRAATV